jgi:hypothetical protein
VRRVLAGIGLMVVLAGAWWSVEDPPVPDAPVVAERPAPQRRVVRYAAPDAPPDQVPMELALAHTRTGDRIANDCQLPLSVTCDPDGCASVLSVPDLDRLAGWAVMTWRHPWFVGQVAGRELGFGAGPCGHATRGTVVRVWEPAGRDEVWCTASPRGPDTDVAALCDRAAADLGIADADFASSDRRLSLDP